MDMRMERDAAPPRLNLAGELTIYAVAELKDRLIGAVDESVAIDVDLSQVSEIDTAGLQLLVLAKRHAAQLGKTLQLRAHSPAVLEIIELFGLAGFFGDPLVLPAQGEAR